jgi:hypothetical protein
MIGSTGKHMLNDPMLIALAALRWVVAEPARAERILAVTGLTPADLRERAGDSALLAAILAYLEAYEPDLIACAAAIEMPVQALVAAREALER